MFYPKNHTPQVKFGVPSGQIKFGCFCRFSALLAVHSALEEKAIAEYHDIHIAVFNLYDIYPPQTSARHTQTPSRHCQTSSNTIQTPAYLACGRLLGEKAIDEYHDIYSTVFNLSDIYLPQTSARNTQTASRCCHTPSDTMNYETAMLSTQIGQF